MQVASLGLLLSGALIMYKSCMLITNSESPIVVVLRCVLSVVSVLLKEGVLVGVVFGACSFRECRAESVSASFPVSQVSAWSGAKPLCTAFVHAFIAAVSVLTGSLPRVLSFHGVLFFSFVARLSQWEHGASYPSWRPAPPL